MLFRSVTLDDNGNIVFTPEENYFGEASFEYTVSDGNGGTDTAMVTVNVESVNDAPVITVTDTAVTEDDSATIIANASDIDGTISLSDSSAQHGTISMDSDGSITYIPDADYNGTDAVTISIADNGGAVTTQTINLVVDPTQDNPVAMDDGLSSTITTDIQIENASFESSEFANGGWDRTVDGWEQSGVSGEFNPTSSHMSGEAIDGDNIGWINSGSISQTLDEVLSENSTYTLALDLGDRADVNAGDYRVTIYAGDQEIGVITQDDLDRKSVV